MQIVGFWGTQASDTSEIVCSIRDKGIGGVILFEPNITQPGDGVNTAESLSYMCTQLQGAATDKLIHSH